MSLHAATPANDQGQHATDAAAGQGQDVTEQVYRLADRARKASRLLARANRDWKDRALRQIGATLDANRVSILQANAKDLEVGRANGTSAAMLDRLKLDDARIDGLIGALEELAGLPDPVGTVLRGGKPCPTGCACARSTCPWAWSAPSTKPART